MKTPLMKWRIQERGIHTHVTVFANGANCGTLVFRTGPEFDEIAVEVMRIAVLEFPGTTQPTPSGAEIKGK